jgi:hypothetical protein
MTMTEGTRNPKFSARDVFHPASPYSAMRRCFDPELKMRGLFYELEARRSIALPTADVLAFEPRNPVTFSRGSGAAAASDQELPPSIAFYSDPPRIVASDRDVQFKRSRANPGSVNLTVRLLVSSADLPSANTACRVFVLTRGILKRLCGEESIASVKATVDELTRLFEGESAADRVKVSETLAATAEMNGVFSPGRPCDFAFALPKQTSDIKSFPDGTVIVFVIETRSGEVSDVQSSV